MSCHDPHAWNGAIELGLFVLWNGALLRFFGDTESRESFVPMCWLIGVPLMLFGVVAWVRQVTGWW